tara:strand:- start:1949 stop:2392 length:444 start_codon:yes stop_codon:yes gene_type:complete
MKKDFDMMISSYLDDDLSSEDKKIFENHMENNPDFSVKVKDIKRIVNTVNNTPRLTTSKDFLHNLEDRISTKSIFNYWFTPKFKTSLSFTVAALALFFVMLNDYNVKQEFTSTEKDFNKESLAGIEVDTLKNDNFLIKQVKGQKHNK